MNVDEAMRLAEAFKAGVGRLPPEVQLGELAAIALASEVERLREANQLLHAKVSSAGAENERLQTELAAAKAASVPTDEEVRAEFEAWIDTYGLSVRKLNGKYFWGETVKRWQAWKTAIDWLRDRMNQRGEGQQ